MTVEAVFVGYFLLLLVASACSVMVAWRIAWRRGYALGRADGEALAEPDPTPSAGRSGAFDGPDDPRPTRRRPARVRTARVVNPWTPPDDDSHPEE